MRINDGGPAFPTISRMNPNSPHGPAYKELLAAGGMSLRDYFAAKAMQSLVGGKGQAEEIEAIVNRSYKMSDAMIAHRGKVSEEK